MVENFSNLRKNIDIKIQGAQQTPNRINLKRPILRYAKIKLLKDEDKENLENSKRKVSSYV